MIDFEDKPQIKGDIILSDASDLLNRLAPASAAVIITDPPYGVGYHSNRYQDRNPHSPIAHDWNFQIGSFLAQAERVLRNGGALYLFTRFDVYPLWTKEIPPSLSLKNMIVWDKGNHSSGDLTGNFGFQHEIVMFITKGRHLLQGHRWSNIWSVPKISHKKLRMPAEKPVELYQRAILSSSRLGELIVDPFVGSGTCAEACILTGRRFLVGDIDKKMVQIARERVGLSPLPTTADSVALPACPVFNVAPPDPSLWGVHPEDILEWRRG